MESIQKALTDLETLADEEDVEDQDDQLAVGLFAVASALDGGTVLRRFDNAGVEYTGEDMSKFSEGEIEIYADWVHVVDDEEWIPRDRVGRVKPM